MISLNSHSQGEHPFKRFVSDTEKLSGRQDTFMTKFGRSYRPKEPIKINGLPAELFK